MARIVILLLGLLPLFSGTVYAGDEPELRTVYVVTLDGRLIEAEYEGFRDGFFLLRLPDHKLEISPNHVRGIFREHRDAEIALNNKQGDFTKPSEKEEAYFHRPPPDGPEEHGADFGESCAMARRIAAEYVREETDIFHLQRLMGHARFADKLPLGWPLEPQLYRPLILVIAIRSEMGAKHEMRQKLWGYVDMLKHSDMPEPKKVEIMKLVLQLSNELDLSRKNTSER